MAVVTPPTMTAAPTSPDRADRATFTARSIALDNWRKNQNVPESTALAANVYANAVDAEASATSAATRAVEAAGSASAAAGAVATSGAVLWVSGVTYALGNLVYSPVDFATYRRKVAGAGTTDPSADATNWVLASGAGTGIVLLASVTLGAVNTVNVTGLAASKRITIVGTGVTFGTPDLVLMKLSVDNGATFPGSAVSISNSSGTPSGNFLQIHNAGFADTKVTTTWVPGNVGSTKETNSTINAGIVNAIQLYSNSGNNFTGGSFNIYGEN